MTYSKKIIDSVKQKYYYQTEFIQTVEEVLESIEDFLEKNPIYSEHSILERLVEPDRTIEFRVSWLDDNNNVQVNKGYRVEFNNAIGPYKGGLRFHPTVNQSVLKFLGFEQIFKNSLTGLPLGGGKGGSDFDPKDKSDFEVMRFTQSFMNELYKYIGANIDVPAGDIGVGGREIGYLFGQYKKLTNSFEGVLTGKGLNWGGSHIRPEATGFGVMYFASEALAFKNSSLKNKRVLVSGSGNVAQFAVEKTIELGGKVITMSDSNGTIYIPDGLNIEQLEKIKVLKNVKRGRIYEITEEYSEIKYMENKNPWEIEADIAVPCATQNEITEIDVKNLINNNIMAVVEGSNMSTTNEAIKLLQNAGVIYVPGKASNAGGVAVSGLEMSQNSLRLNWSRKEVDQKLQDIMKSIHSQIKIYGESEGFIDYVKGANTAGFKKVADSMLDQGIV